MRKRYLLAGAVLLSASQACYSESEFSGEYFANLFTDSKSSLMDFNSAFQDENSKVSGNPFIPLKDAPGVEPEKSSLTWDSYTIKPGDNLGLIFSRANIPHDVLVQVIEGSGDASELQKIYPGRIVKFGKTKDGDLHSVELEKSGLESLIVEKNDDGYVGRSIFYEPDVKQRYAGGKIKSSLFKAGKDSGLSTRLIMDLASIFAWDIDFAKDIHKGDSFHIIYEELYRNGKKVGTGDILSASFKNGKTQHDAVLYTSEDGSSDYYTPNGKSLRKAFLRSPVDLARISSHFNLQRRHPILHTIRAHKGTDYAAAPGTPIKASGDGKIIRASTYGGYGNTVVIQHGGKTTTLYAHMKNFAPGIYAGKRIKQGEIIGYIGSSGLATGPHLHYEFRVDGKPKDPVNIDLADANPVPKNEIDRFKLQTQAIMMALETRANGSTQSIASINIAPLPQGE